MQLIICVPTGAAEQSQWVRFSRAASKMYSRKDYQRAADLYGQAARFGEEEHRHPEEIANTLLNLSDCQIEIGTYGDAWATLVRARTIIQKQNLVEDPIAIRLTRRQTYFYRRQGLYQQAVACQKNVVERVRSIFGDSTALIAEYIVLQYLQEDYARQHADSIQTGLAALEMMKRDKLDPYSDKWLFVYNRTGISMLATGDIKGATDLCLLCVRTAVRNKSVLFGGTSVEQLVNIAAKESDPKKKAALVAEVLPLAEKLNAVHSRESHLAVEAAVKRLLDMQKQLGIDSQ